MVRIDVKYFLMVVIVWFSGLATEYFRNVNATITLFVVAAIYILYKKNNIRYAYVISVLYWFVYILLSYVKYQGVNYFWPISGFCYLTIAYAIILYYENTFIEYFSSVMYFFAKLSLVFYSWQVISLDTMLPLWVAMDLSNFLYEKSYTYYAHFLFYTIHQFKDLDKGAVRNSGFCWEPGAFACFLVLGLYFSSLVDKFQIKKNIYKYTVFLVAIGTTLSTTGFAALLIWAVMFVYNMPNKSKAPYYYLTAIICLAFFYYLPDQYEKIENQFNDSLISQVRMLASSDEEKGLGRFQSLSVYYLDLIENPIFGLGANQAAGWLASTGLDVNATYGLAKLFATYGLFIMIPYFYFSIMSSRMYAAMYGVKGGYFYVAIVISIGFSFGIIDTPILIALSLYSLLGGGYFFYRKN